ncbi:MAG: hypothetical protein CL521_00465 [Actinobacteria bacterium]|nr:hypothetical protein [Actinomycetota bacterium]|tara:strand:+ start:270 stop:761 length:492 start_codon:yes stop_codon:yes gene_type:complete
MIRNFQWVGIFAMLGLLFCTGCFQSELMLGEEVVVERQSRKVPKWVLVPLKKDRKYYYFVGQDKSQDQDPKFAYQMALASVSAFASTKVTALYEKSQDEGQIQIRDTNKKSVIKTFSESLLSGVIHQRTYWEKVNKLTPTGVVSYYRMYVLVAVPKELVDSVE